MKYKITELDQALIIEEISGKIRCKLFNKDRFTASFGVFLRESITQDCDDDDLPDYIPDLSCIIRGNNYPFKIAKESLLKAIENGTFPATDDIEQFIREISMIVSASGFLKIYGLADLSVQYSRISDFLTYLVRTIPETPKQIHELAQNYQQAAFQHKKGISAHAYVYDLNFTGDWVYQMVIDLVYRQCVPTDALCILVVAEPMDMEFVDSFIEFRTKLDKISGDYVHFFALSKLEGGSFSVEGKRQLVKELRDRNIAVKEDQPFLIFISLREIQKSGNYVADIEGTFMLQKGLKSGDVMPILRKISEIAREAKINDYSFDKFIKIVCHEISWLKITQKIRRLPLLYLLENAMNFTTKWMIGN